MRGSWIFLQFGVGWMGVQGTFKVILLCTLKKNFNPLLPPPKIRDCLSVPPYINKCTWAVIHHYIGLQTFERVLTFVYTEERNLSSCKQQGFSYTQVIQGVRRWGWYIFIKFKRVPFYLINLLFIRVNSCTVNLSCDKT